MRKAVDYVVGFLVNDSVAMMKQLFDDLHESQRATLLADLEYIAAYLECGFDSRLKDFSAPACVLHQIPFALSSTSQDTTNGGLCADCRGVLDFFHKVKVLFDNANPDVLDVVEDCLEKAILFFGHRVRVVNQQQELAKVAAEIKSRCEENGSSDEAIVIIDYTMKLEPLYNREKTVEHYGKRGMSWHGALIQYYCMDEASERPEAVDQRMYFDHISSGDTKQDREAVIAMVEAILLRLKRDLPHIKRIVIQSDNASCYQNVLVPLVCPYLSVTHGIFIARFMHTETQDGKSVLDAHFARSMYLLMSWIRSGNDCITPTQAVVGLLSRGGLPNTVVELVEHDRDVVGLLVQEMSAIVKAARKYIKRANDIQFELSSMEL